MSDTPETPNHHQEPNQGRLPDTSHQQPTRRVENLTPPLLTEVTRKAMATEFAILLPPHSLKAVELAVTTLERLDEIEQTLTIYRPDSEVSRINQMANEHPVFISTSTFQLIEKALLWSQRTKGAFDITAGPLVKAWGFTERSGRKPGSDEIESARERVGYQYLLLDSTQRTVQFDKPDMSINLGGIGKGDALDQIASELRRGGLNDFLIHGGNSSVLAAGDQDVGSGMGWPIGISHPTKPKRRLAGVWLRDQALATSGSGKQFFHHRGKRYGHVIDPRTGFPAGDLASLTIITASAADADACSTGLFVSGSSRNRNDEQRTLVPQHSAHQPRPTSESDERQLFWRNQLGRPTRSGNTGP